MAVFAFGANYDGKDVFNDFINNNCVGIGWSYKDNTSGHNMIRSMKADDIVYIKNCNMGSDITIRAIGIITDFDYKKVPGVAEIARNVKWIDTNSFVVSNPKNTDKNNVRSNSVYEEFNLDVIAQIISKI